MIPRPASEDHIRRIKKDAEHCIRYVYDRAVRSGQVTSVGKALALIASEQAPGTEAIWDTDVLSRWVRAHAHFDPPLLLIRPLTELTLELNKYVCQVRDGLQSATPDPETVVDSLEEDGVAVRMEQYGFFYRAAVVLHPFADAVLSAMLPRQTLVNDMFTTDDLSREAALQVEPYSWHPFLDTVATSIACDQIRLILPRMSGHFVLEPTTFETGICKSLVETGYPALYEAVFPLHQAKALARELFTKSTYYEGPAGKALVVHANDADALNLQISVQQAVQMERSKSVFDTALKLMESERKINAITRANQFHIEKSWGLSHREIARRWLECGLIEPEWDAPESPKAQDSAEVQIRKLARKLGYPPGPCGKSPR